MVYISFIVSAIFIVVGVLHIYWAFGGKALVGYAVPSNGDKPMFRPSMFITLLVALALFVLAYTAYGLHEINKESPIYQYFIYIAWFSGGFFILRAIGDFNSVGFFKKIKDTGFAKYDILIYSPLFLLFGLYFLVSVI